MARLPSLFRYHGELSVFILFLSLSAVFMALPSSPTIEYVTSFNRTIMSPVQWVTSYLTSMQDMNRKIQELEKRNSQLSLELSRSRSLFEENRRLRELLSFGLQQGVEFRPARVISLNINEPITTVLIDEGSGAGITIDSPVMQPEGLVGKVIEVDGETSLVQIFTNAQFRAAAMVPERGEMGILRSTGNELQLMGLSVNTEIVEGDRVVTSGLGGVYPMGIPIGEVTAVDEDRIGIEKVATVKPFVSLSKLFEVAVLVDERFVDPDTSMLLRSRGTLDWLWYEQAGGGER
jgi:rod shape-determining protein MreC